jgi:hypothetical protein
MIGSFCMIDRDFPDLFVKRFICHTYDTSLDVGCGGLRLVRQTVVEKFLRSSVFFIIYDRL